MQRKAYVLLGSDDLKVMSASWDLTLHTGGIVQMYAVRVLKTEEQDATGAGRHCPKCDQPLRRPTKQGGIEWFVNLRILICSC